MALVTFSADFTFTPENDPEFGIDYAAGQVVDVSDECAVKAVAAGAATTEDLLILNALAPEPPPYGPEFEIAIRAFLADHPEVISDIFGLMLEAATADYQ